MATYVNEFLFGFYPYLCMVVYFFGSWARFDRSQYTWRSQSSQLLRRRQLMRGSMVRPTSRASSFKVHHPS
jgi:nitrate reductase gamma subunit